MCSQLTVTQKPRIAILSLHSCPLGNLGAKDTGGMSVYIREAATELAKLGFEIDIFTRKHGPHDSDIIQLAPGARLMHIKAGPEQEIVNKLSLYTHAEKFAVSVDEFRFRENQKYELVFSHYWLSGIAGLRLSRLWGVRHMVMFHTLAAVKNRLGVGDAEPELRLKGEKHVIRQSDRIIAATAAEKQNLVDLYSAGENTVCVIPCGVNTSLFKPAATLDCSQADSNIKQILYVGRIEPLKGLDVLLDSLALLETCHEWRCIIAGGGDSSSAELARLKKKACRLGIGNNLVFPGLIPQEKLVSYYNQADVFVMPSYYESFGLVALEALASGCPVVATDVGELKHIIQQGVTGHVIAEPREHLLAEKIGYWINRSRLTAQERMFISAAVKDFRWEKVAGLLAIEFNGLRHEQPGAVCHG